MNIEVLTLNNLKIVIFIGYFFVVMLVILLSWLYSARTVRATKAIGLHAPDYIKVMVRVSIINAIVTACLISFFLFTNIYKF